MLHKGRRETLFVLEPSKKWFVPIGLITNQGSIQTGIHFDFRGETLKKCFATSADGEQDDLQCRFRCQPLWYRFAVSNQVRFSVSAILFANSSFQSFMDFEPPAAMPLLGGRREAWGRLCL